jgi:hypothetical protein
MPDNHQLQVHIDGYDNYYQRSRDDYGAGHGHCHGYDNYLEPRPRNHMHPLSCRITSNDCRNRSCVS